MEYFKRKYWDINLIGGLGNKFFCLFSACEIAIKNNLVLIEPYFGLKRKVLFSDIYDIEFFNNTMKNFNNGKNLMISRKKVSTYLFRKNKKYESTSLWNYSENLLKNQRNCSILESDCMNIVVLKALRLNEKYNQVINTFPKIEDYTALQIRTESDWIKHSKKIIVDKDEKVFVSAERIIKMLKEFELGEQYFITSGENHLFLERIFNLNNYDVKYFFDKKFEYEINAAINFELCTKARYFIGHSRSTFSNLITLKRALQKNDNSFIYNYENKIIKRIDKGLHPIARQSISEKTIIHQ